MLYGDFKNYWAETASSDAIMPLISMNYDGLQFAIIEIISGAAVKVDTAVFTNDPSRIASKGDVLTYIVDAARAEGEKREPVADSRQIQDLQEKLLAAHRAGIDTVLIPKENLKDLEEVPANVREALTIIPAEDVHTVLETALCEKPTPKQQA